MIDAKIKVILVFMVTLIIAFFFTDSYVSAQEYSLCGEVHNRSGTGAFTPVLVVWGTDQYIFLPVDKEDLYNQLNEYGIPGYYRFHGPVLSQDNIYMSDYSYVEKVSGCEATQTPTIPPTATFTYTPEPTQTPTPYPTSTPLSPTATSIPVIPTAVPYGEALPGDGYEPGVNIWEQIKEIFVPPVEAYSAADCQARFTVNNCTWFVAGKRTDVCQWITPGQGNAYQWTSQAQQNGDAFGIFVNKKPKSVGEIVVWSPGCAYSGESGHVAIVTGIGSDGKTIDIDEMNWTVGNGHRTIKIEDCMDFISLPSTASAGSPTSIPSSIQTPNPVVVPTPSGTPSNFFQWIFGLFSH